MLFAQFVGADLFLDDGQLSSEMFFEVVHCTPDAAIGASLASSSVTFLRFGQH
jgi:energy-converting hydrogenase Eha subunit B